MLHSYRLEQQIQEFMQEAHVPGLAVAIVEDQDIVYARGFGVTSVEEGGIPVTPRPSFVSGRSRNP